jgi:hypothetical protein
MLLFALAMAGLAVPHPAAAAGDPMDMVPANSLFCVRINGLDNALGQVDLFLAGLAPMQISMLAKMQLGQVLGNPQLAGVDTAGSIAIFGPLPGSPDPTRIGVLIPTTSYQQFVSGNPGVTEPDPNGVSTIGPPGSPMMAVTQVGDFALASPAGTALALAPAKQTLAAASAGLAASLDAAEKQQATSAPVWAYANLQMAGQMFGPVVQAKIQEAKQAMQAMPAQGQAAAGVMDMYASLFDTLMKEARFASLALQPSGTKVGVAFTLAATPGTGMAEMLQGGAAADISKLVGYMSDGAAVNFAGSMEGPFWKKFGQAYANILPKMLGATGADPEGMSQLKQMILDTGDAYSGSFAGSLTIDAQTKPPMAVTYVIGLKDAQKFQELMDKVTAIMNEGPIADFYQKMGMKMTFEVKRNAETYKGTAIDTMKFNVEATGTGSMQAQMMDQMYGDGLNFNMAAVNNQLVVAAAQEPGAAVKKLIDQVKAGGPAQTPAEVQAAMGLIPGADKADFFATFNILRLMQMVMAASPMPMPPMQINSQSNAAMMGSVGNGKMTIQLAVPKQHVQEIMGTIMQLQMQQQQMQQPPTQQPPM